MAAAVRALGLLSPHQWDLSEGPGALAASGIGRHCWTGRQHCGEIRGVFTCRQERELTRAVWVLRAFVTHMSRVKLRGSSLAGLAGPWDMPLTTLQSLPPLWTFPWPGSAGAALGTDASASETHLRAACTWPHLRRRMVRSLPPLLQLDQAPAGHAPVRLCADWEVAGWVGVTYSPGDCGVVSASSHGPATAHLLFFPVWCPALSPRFRRAEGQLVGGGGVLQRMASVLTSHVPIPLQVKEKLELLAQLILGSVRSRSPRGEPQKANPWQLQR